MFKKQQEGQQYSQNRTHKAKNVGDEAKEIEKLGSDVRHAEALGLFSELKREALRNISLASSRVDGKASMEAKRQFRGYQKNVGKR